MKKEIKKEIRCPFCNRIKAVVKHNDDDNVYFCKHCDKLFENK